MPQNEYKLGSNITIPYLRIQEPNNRNIIKNTVLTCKSHVNTPAI